jgi:HSP20 family molecular chaperone IbpA
VQADGDSTAEVVEAPEEKLQKSDSTVLRYERFDSFQSRSFRMPKTADLSTITAKYADGVLTVDIQKKEDALESRRTVDIA